MFTNNETNKIMNVETFLDHYKDYKQYGKKIVKDNLNIQHSILDPQKELTNDIKIIRKYKRNYKRTIIDCIIIVLSVVNIIVFNLNPLIINICISVISFIIEYFCSNINLLYFIDNKYSVIIMITLSIIVTYYLDLMLLIPLYVFFSIHFLFSIFIVHFKYSLFHNKIVSLLSQESDILNIKNNNENIIKNFYDIIYNEFVVVLNNNEIILDDKYLISLFSSLLYHYSKKTEQIEQFSEKISLFFDQRTSLRKSIKGKYNIIFIASSILTIVNIVITAIVLLYLYDLSSVILFTSSIILSASFIIGMTMSQGFQSLIYIFTSHCEIGSFIFINKVYYKICDIGLYYSILQQLNGSFVYMENVQLYKHNICILDKIIHTFTFIIDISSDNITKIKDLIKEYSMYYHEESRNVSITIEDRLKMKMFIRLSYKYTEDIIKFNEFLTNDYIFIIKILQDLKVTYTGVDNGIITL